MQKAYQSDAKQSFAIVPNEARSNRIKDEYALTDANIRTLIQAGVIPSDCPKAQVEVLAEFCRQAKLSPFRKQVAIMGFYSKKLQAMTYSIVITNDGLRTLINRTGRYGGCEPTTFNKGLDFYDIQCLMERDGVESLKTCTFTAYYYDVRGNKNKFTKTIAVGEFSRGSTNFKWGSMPLQMAEKTAKSFCYKEMLGDEMSGFVVDAEIKHDFSENEVTVAPAEIAETSQDEILMFEANEICELAESQNDLKDAVSMFTKKHQIANLAYCPEIRKMFNDRFLQLSKTGRNTEGVN